MKITRNTADRLDLVYAPRAGAAIFAAATLTGAAMLLLSWTGGNGAGAVAGGFVLVLSAASLLMVTRRIELMFDRPSGSVILWRRGLLGTTQRTWALSTLRGVEAERADARRVSTYRPVLVFRDGSRVPVVTFPYAGDGAGDAVRGIDAWLALDRGGAPS